MFFFLLKPGTHFNHYATWLTSPEVFFFWLHAPLDDFSRIQQYSTRPVNTVNVNVYSRHFLSHSVKKEISKPVQEKKKSFSLTLLCELLWLDFRPWCLYVCDCQVSICVTRGVIQSSWQKSFTVLSPYVWKKIWTFYVCLYSMCI